MDKLILSKMQEWTAEQCVAVYRSLDYQGCGEWYSKLTDEYLDSDDHASLNSCMAHFYVESLDKSAAVDNTE